jgi:hypothetical protein
MKHDPENPKLPAPDDPRGADDLPEHPHFENDADHDLYWRGVTNGLRMGAASNVTIVGDARDAPVAGRHVRRARVDGLSGVKQAVFLEGIAAGMTVGEAAAKAEISVTAIYNFANRRAGRAFAIGWDAASRRSRRPFADHLMERSIKGQAETLRDKDDALIGTRHRYDNRLAMAMLTRADKKAEAYREDERLIAAVSEEFEELLDILEAEGDAASFVESRRPAADDYPPQGWVPEADDGRKALYYRWRSEEEEERLPPGDFDRYPDSARGVPDEADDPG